MSVSETFEQLVLFLHTPQQSADHLRAMKIATYLAAAAVCACVITRASAKCALGAKFDDQTGSACPKAEESKVEPSVSTQSGSLHFNVDNGKTSTRARARAQASGSTELGSLHGGPP